MSNNPPGPENTAALSVKSSTLQSKTVEQFRRIEEAFRAMKSRDIKLTYLLDDCHAEATKAIRSLFKAIDAGYLPGLWKPGERPYVHLKTAPYGDKGGRVIVRAEPSRKWLEAKQLLNKNQNKLAWPKSIEGKRTWEIYTDHVERGETLIPDKKLDDQQLAESWSWAISNLYVLYPERFAFGDCTLDFSSEIGIIRVISPCKKKRRISAGELLRLQRLRCGAYADACGLVAELIECFVPEVPYERKPSPIPMSQATFAFLITNKPKSRGRDVKAVLRQWDFQVSTGYKNLGTVDMNKVPKAYHDRLSDAACVQ